MERISVSGPSITQKEIDYVVEAVSGGWYENANAFQERFELAFAEYVGTKFAVCLPSCTSAIHLSLLSLGVGAGDEVIVPDITWIATAAPVSYVGASPVFADIDKHSWCLSVESFEACITSRTRAVIPVDLYGNLPEMDAILAVAREREIPIIEDAAEAIGTELLGKRAGSFGDIGVFSFHGSKTLTTGEGGMLVTDREDLYRSALILRDHGRRPGDTMFFNEQVAFKYKMSSMQAALGLAQLERVDELVARKREIFKWYAEGLCDVEGIVLNSERTGLTNSYWMVTVVFDPQRSLRKERFIDLMRSRSIDCRPFFHPLSSIPAYARTEQAGAARKRNHVSYQLSPFGVNLPSGLNMDRERVDRVCLALREAVRQGAV